MKTTFENSKQQSHKETVNALQGIIEKNYDAEKGYKQAIQNTNNQALKGFLKDQAANRSRFATAIDQKLRNLGETPRESGSVTGNLHRTWMDIKSFVGGNDDKAVLEEVIRGEKASVEEYQDILKNHNLAPEITQELQSQVGDIQGTLDKVQRLEDIQM